MATSSFSNSLTVSEVQNTTSIDCFLNVLRRRENFTYRTSVPVEAVSVSFVGSEPVTSDKNLFVSDRSSSLISNRIDITEEYSVVENISVHEIETDKFVVTDIFTPEDSTIPFVPLFFKHVLSLEKVPRSSADTFALESNIKLLDVAILDQFLNPVGVGESFVDRDTGVVYNNLVTEYSPSDGSYTLYFIRYSVKIDSSVFTYIELLSNQEVYRLAEFDDLDSSLNIIQDGRKVFLLDEITGGFQITLPSVSTYAFRITQEAKIQIIPPFPIDINDPWRVAVSNANIFGTVEGVSYKYSIAEFLNQSWSPVPPTKRVIDEESTIVSKSLIKLDKQKIVQDPDTELFVNISVSDRNGTPLAIFTTDPSLSGTVASNGLRYSKWSLSNPVGIRSIDAKLGMVDIDGFALKGTYQIESQYYFEETNYEFTLFDFNPINNPDILGKRVSLFIYPDTLTSTSTQTLFYLISDEAGRIIQSNWADFDNSAQMLHTTAAPIFYDGIPDYLVPTLSGDVEIFVDDYSIEGSGIFLILGDMYVGEHTSPDLATLIDSRVRGGGINPDRLDEIRLRNAEAAWFWDVGFWDGIPYPGNASVFIEVPAEVLEGAGGVFKTNEIKDIANRHIAHGVYAILKAYGIDPLILTVESGATFIDITWTNHPEIKFNVYYGLSPTGPWTKSNSSLIDNNLSGNSFTIDNLESNVQYYFFVVGGRLDEEGDWIPISGQPIGPGELEAIGITNPNIKTARTFAPRVVTSSSLGNSFSVI